MSDLNAPIPIVPLRPDVNQQRIILNQYYRDLRTAALPNRLSTSPVIHDGEIHLEDCDVIVINNVEYQGVEVFDLLTAEQIQSFEVAVSMVDQGYIVEADALSVVTSLSDAVSLNQLQNRFADILSRETLTPVDRFIQLYTLQNVAVQEMASTILTENIMATLYLRSFENRRDSVADVYVNVAALSSQLVNRYISNDEALQLLREQLVDELELLSEESFSDMMQSLGDYFDIDSLLAYSDQSFEQSLGQQIQESLDAIITENLDAFLFISTETPEADAFREHMRDSISDIQDVMVDDFSFVVGHTRDIMAQIGAHQIHDIMIENTKDFYDRLKIYISRNKTFRERIAQQQLKTEEYIVVM
ncbi:hypothetical protein ACFL56_03800, partial [Candidatus Margulisiibacteriota bacterium]